jgi:Na+-translocating ferredoxin:NAD+ oxidoreductase subunit B
MNTSILILLVMAVLGITFGLILAFANKKFAIEVNPLIHIVEDILPKGQCGACGYAGCMAYAEAVVTNPDVPPNMCVPGKAAVAARVAELTGKQAEAVEPRAARIMCGGGLEQAKRSYEYEGVQTCAAANVLFGGPKSCTYGCLGFGDCVATCPFGAMTLGDNHLPQIDTEKCTGCGACQKACPKQVIAMVPLTAKVHVSCKSSAKGAEVRKICTVGCLSCTLCMRQCTHDAIKMVNNLPVVDHSKCVECTEAKCVEKCPTKAIHLIQQTSGEPPVVQAPTQAATVTNAG